MDSEDDPIAQADCIWEYDEDFERISPPAFFRSKLLSTLSSHSFDTQVRFSFHSSYPNQSDISIHRCLLLLVQGPLEKLVTSGFIETKTNHVQLCAEDDPHSFGIIKKFLYGVDIDFVDYSPPEILQVIRCAHRWNLIGLVNSAFVYIEASGMFLRCEITNMLDFKNSLNLPGVSKTAIITYWEILGMRFGELYGILNGWEKSEHLDNNSYSLQNMYEDAISQRGLPVLLRNAAKGNDTIRRKLLNDLMMHLEPKMDSDKTFLTFFKLIKANSYCYWKGILNDGDLDGFCSGRAMRRLAKAVKYSQWYDKPEWSGTVTLDLRKPSDLDDNDNDSESMSV